MDDTLIIAIGVGTGIMVVAMFLQLGVWMALFLTARRVQTGITSSTPRIRALLSSARTVADENRGEAIRIKSATAEIANLARRDLRLVDQVRLDAMGRFRHERELAQEVAGDARLRARKTSEFIGRGIKAPVRAIQDAIRRLRHAA